MSLSMSDPNTNPFLLELNNVCREFDSEPAVQALIDVDLRVAMGEWLAITGPSGAGKSTLLNIIGCLDRLTSGTYSFDGVDTAALNDRARAGLRSCRIGFVFQSFHLLAYRSVLENVMLAEVYRKGAHDGRRKRARMALDRVGLGHRVDFLPTKLSGGEKQRVAIARALVGSPDLLLCDEPTGNLDSNASASLLDLFAQLNQQGLTLIVVTHDENVAKRARRRVQIVDGKLTDITTQPLPPNDPPNPSLIWDESVVSHDNSPPNLGRDQEELSVQTRRSSRPISRSGISLRDLLDEALAGIFARPGRMALTVLGIVIGLTALVATLGLSRTASNRVITQFDELAATEILVTAKSASAGLDPPMIPWDASERLQRLNGVVAAGTLSEVEIGNVLVSASPVRDPLRQSAFTLAVQAASPSLYAAVRASLATGRLPDWGHSQRADRVAVLGPAAAQRLGIVDVAQLPAIAIGDHLYLVIGILREVARQPDLLASVIIPEGTARRDFNLVGPGEVIIETQIGATALIVRQTALALRPDNPEVLKIESAPEPQRVRDAVQRDLNVMFLLLGGLSLVVGAIGIGNITLVSVIERIAEIGLRRAIGATRTHIAAQFLLESTSIGVIGGILGASLGVLLVVAVSAYQLWMPVLDPVAPILAPVIGGAIGLVSGVYPAIRAARMEPVEAFRH